MTDPLLEAYRILRRPLLTEKGSAQIESRNAYSFEVPRNANKIQIRQAVERLYGVKVLSVQTARRRGKARRRGRVLGHEPDWKKAIVRLRSGDHIEV